MKIYIYILEQDLELLYDHLTNKNQVQKEVTIWYVNTTNYKNWIQLSLNVNDFIWLKDNNILKHL